MVRCTLGAAKAVDFPIQTFRGTKNVLPQALAMWEGHTKVEEARRGAEARAREQLCCKEEERERRRWLAELRAVLPKDTLASLLSRAEAALATDGINHTRLGYDVLVKLKRDELLEREYLPGDARANEKPPAMVVTSPDPEERVCP